MGENSHKTPNPSPVSHPKATADQARYKAPRRESKPSLLQPTSAFLPPNTLYLSSPLDRISQVKTFLLLCARCGWVGDVHILERMVRGGKWWAVRFAQRLMRKGKRGGGG